MILTIPMMMLLLTHYSHKFLLWVVSIIRLLRKWLNSIRNQLFLHLLLRKKKIRRKMRKIQRRKQERVQIQKLKRVRKRNSKNRMRNNHQKMIRKRDKWKMSRKLLLKRHQKKRRRHLSQKRNQRKKRPRRKHKHLMLKLMIY